MGVPSQRKVFGRFRGLSNGVNNTAYYNTKFHP